MSRTWAAPGWSDCPRTVHFAQTVVHRARAVRMCTVAAPGRQWLRGLIVDNDHCSWTVRATRLFMEQRLRTVYGQVTVVVFVSR
jgi:hypothetical protein